MNKKYMALALSLAKKGKGHTGTNPIVGAVIVKNGQIIGEGYHKNFGGPHAEVEAISNATASVEGSTMYVTLEPCSHYGKTPPCANLIVENKIKEIFIGCTDPNHLVRGRGISFLKEHGVIVNVGLLEEECLQANEVFIKYITTKEPFVVMKNAITLDGKIATKTGDSKWISGIESRKDSNYLRGIYKGIMIGVDTAIKDNPKLTCRLDGFNNPTVIIVDSTLRVSPTLSLFTKSNERKVIILTTDNCNKEMEVYLKGLGVTILKTPSYRGRVNLNYGMILLGERGIDSILLEGGGNLNFSALEAGIVDKVVVYVAPKIIGGREAKTSVEGAGILTLKDTIALKNVSFKNIGMDIKVEGYIDRGTSHVYRNN